MNHILITPIKEKVSLEKSEVKWCFKCKQKVKHSLKNIVWDSDYYDPTTIWECVECKEDNTRFPQ